MTVLAKASMEQIAREVASALVRVSAPDEGVARLSLPMMYPGGSMVGIEIAKLRDGYLVSDAGAARREAGLMGGEKAFQRIARDVAERFAIRFDRNMMFDLDVTHDEIFSAVVAVANAARTAVENTALHLATADHADYRAHLWEKLEHAYHIKIERRSVSFRGSTELWEFDAAINLAGRTALFQIVTPNANSVHSAVAKFVDIRDLGTDKTRRIAVLTDQHRTPRLPLLGRSAKTISFDASAENFRAAA